MTARKKNKKYISILKTAKALFWKHGIRRVTIEEICKEATVSKMTFYKFFPNKPDLALTILDNLIQSSIVKFKDIVSSEVPFSQKLEEIFLLKLEGMNNISMEFINDIYTNPELGLKEYMEVQKQKSIKITVDFYKDAQEKGFIRPDVKIDFLLAFSNQIIEMMKNEQLMAQYAQPQDFVIEAMNVMFYGITTGNE
ncbi:MAG: TetR/AcrR family transcriptional regulator [Mariniphaga sp.]|jgi:AcrR family transcriptional regulator|nr:TetR/AcrR family transcriptional regulator [Mariniphaga sp.]